MLFIGPPFGNYISLPETISIRGSFTLYPRSGLLSQIWKTLHYSEHYNGWVNKIGLRNPGIDAAIKKYHLESDDIFKIEGISPDEGAPNDARISMSFAGMGGNNEKAIKNINFIF